MKKLLLSFLLLTICAFAQDKLPAIITAKGDLDIISAHVQGACCSEDAIYLSHMKGIFKFDWSGKLLKHVALPAHTGDICYYKGRIYDALSAQDGNNLIVLDEELNILAKHQIPACDGITALNDTLYIGTGPCPQNPHRFNDITTYTLNGEKIAKTTLDYGYETFFGIQDFATDGKYLYAMFYAANGGNACLVLTPDLKIVRSVNFVASTGFDFLPPSRNRGPHPRCLRVTHIGGDWHTQNPQTQPAQVRIDFHEVVDGNFVNITAN